MLADSVTLARIFGEHARAGCKRLALLVKVVALRENGVTEMVRRLNFTGSVEDLVGRFKEGSSTCRFVQ